MWNLQYFRNIDGHHASLNYAHYTFRKVEGMNRHVGYSRAALSGNYKNVSSLVFPSFICSKQRDVTIHFQSQIVWKYQLWSSTNISYEEIEWMERCCPSTFHPYFVFPGVAAVIQFTVLSIHRLWRFDDKQWFEMSEINDVMVNLPKWMIQVTHVLRGIYSLTWDCFFVGCFPLRTSLKLYLFLVLSSIAISGIWKDTNGDLEDRLKTIRFNVHSTASKY